MSTTPHPPSFLPGFPPLGHRYSLPFQARFLITLSTSILYPTSQPRGPFPPTCSLHHTHTGQAGLYPPRNPLPQPREVKQGEVVHRLQDVRAGRPGVTLLFLYRGVKGGLEKERDLP